MDGILKFIEGISDKYGLVGLLVLLVGGLIAYIILKEVADWKKKKNGDTEYVPAKDFKEWTGKMEAHLEKEALEDIQMGELKVRLGALEDKVATENGHLFNQTAKLFDKMDALGAKMDNKFDTLTQIILEKK